MDFAETFNTSMVSTSLGIFVGFHYLEDIRENSGYSFFFSEEKFREALFLGTSWRFTASQWNRFPVS
ncbi:hypothetical protein J53TS2_01780 [Paenibacillus sp. J53TS2]|nr:hypothetical protein J53TS2_01780 [Paenibacillus sp. J53TS2]